MNYEDFEDLVKVIAIGRKDVIPPFVMDQIKDYHDSLKTDSKYNSTNVAKYLKLFLKHPDSSACKKMSLHIFDL